MSKIDTRLEILPDIEMYGGNADRWELPLYKPTGGRYKYSEIKNRYQFQLVIKDYGYTHRSNGETYFTLTKTGELIYDDDMSASIIFKFQKSDTLDRYGKYTYQVIATYEDDYHVAQGNLFITKNIDQ